MRLSLLLSLICSLLFISCRSAPESPPQRQERALQLATAITSRWPQVDAQQARAWASLAVETSQLLAEHYHIQTGCKTHNALINMHLKTRGLCWQWAEDLQAALSRTLPVPLVMTPIVAYPGSTLREHNALRLGPPGSNFGEGLVLDPWRQEGILLFPVVHEDEYPWQPSF